MNKYSQMLMTMALAGVVAACGTTTTTDAGTGGGTATGGGAATGGGSATGGGTTGGFTQPAGTVAVNMTIDDTANKAYANGDIAWKGSMKYDSATRIATKDSSWGGPFAKMYDDGPWNMGGHEPAGNVAGDHKFGATIFIAPPATGSDTYEYGAIDTTNNDGWIWRGSNGSFMIAAGATAAITGTGLTIPAFGTTDVKITLDKNSLLARTLGDGGVGSWDTTKVQIKGSGWAWSYATLADDGMKGDDTAADGKFTFVMSQFVGAGKQFPHSGLGAQGDKIQFVFGLGPGDAVEYKETSGTAAKAGVKAYTKASGAATWTEITTIPVNSDKNTYVEIQ
jgi:hypothetical protein